LKLGHDKYELYDLTVDLSEKTDLAPRHPEIVHRMKAELERWQQSVVRSYRGADYRSASASPPRQAWAAGARTVDTPRAAAQEKMPGGMARKRMTESTAGRSSRACGCALGVANTIGSPTERG